MITSYSNIISVTTSNVDPDYQAVLNYATSLGYTLPSVGQQVKQNQLMLNLKAGGIWSKLDTFAVFATDGSSNFALIDWKRLVLMTAVNSPTFTTNDGFQGNGTSSYIDTNFNPSTQGVNYTQNSAGVSVNCSVIPTTNARNYVLGTNSTTNGEVRLRMQISLSDQQINGAIAIAGSGLNTLVTGNLHTDRVNSTQIVSQINSTLGLITTNNSTGLPQNNIWILRLATLYSDARLRFHCSRSGFTETEKNNLNTVINTYITSL